MVPITHRNRAYSDAASPFLAHHEHAFLSWDSQRNRFRGNFLIIQAMGVNLEALREPVENRDVYGFARRVYQLHKVGLVIQPHARRYENTFVGPEMPKCRLAQKDGVDTRENANFASVPTLQEHAMEGVRSGQRDIEASVTDTVNVERIWRESTADETRYVPVGANLVAQERGHHGKYRTRGSEIVRAVFKVHHPPNDGTLGKLHIALVREVRQVRQRIHHVEMGERGRRLCELNARGNCIFVSGLCCCEWRNSTLLEKCV